MNRFKFTALTALTLLCCACASDSKSPIEPEKKIVKDDPTNEALIESLRRTLEKSGAPLATSYKFVRIDLNNDGRRDALMMLKTPYGYWCEVNGCTMMIFKANAKDFTLINKTAPIREPVYVSNYRTNGWKNLIVRVSGRADKAKNVSMQFDGRAYPKDPSRLRPFRGDATAGSIRVLYQ